MPSEWREATIDEIKDPAPGAIAMGPFGSDIKTDNFVPTGVPVIRGNNLGGRRFKEEGFVFLTEAKADSLRNANAFPGDLVFTHRGTLGQVGLIPEKSRFPRYVVSQSQMKLTCDRKRADPLFLYYFFISPPGQAELLANANPTGVPAISQPATSLKRIKLRMPPLPIQHAIARILGALDDKIELNRKMNETLEQMARAIFKSWFVDFEPFRVKGMVDSPLGKIPKGWSVHPVEDIAKRVAMGPFGSSIKVETFVPKGVPVISGQHLWGIMLDDLDYDFVTPEHADKLCKANVYRGDVVFTHAGSIGQVAWVPESSKYERYVISQRQFYMRCDLAKVSPSYVVYYFSSPEGQHKLLANTSSSGVPSISRPVTYLRSIQMPVPPRRVLDEFESVVRPVHLQMRSQVAQSLTLAAIRDALLPKLMSGKVQVEAVAS